MNYVFSEHAKEQMHRRGIALQDVMRVMDNPDEVLPEDGLWVYQSLLEMEGQLFLLRVFVNLIHTPNVIVTLYRTSKIKKYYEGKI